jgi:hypothetical protein
VYCIRSAYRMLVDVKHKREAWLDGTASGSDHTRESNEWTLMWKVNVP